MSKLGVPEYDSRSPLALKSSSHHRAKAGFFGHAGGVPGLNGADRSAEVQDGVSWVGGLHGLDGANGFAVRRGGVV